MKKYGTPCIVVDFGTATTFNAISKDAEFHGGAISPGLFTVLKLYFSVLLNSRALNSHGRELRSDLRPSRQCSRALLRLCRAG